MTFSRGGVTSRALRAYYLAGGCLIAMAVLKSSEAEVGSAAVRVAAAVVVLAWLPFAANVGGIAAALAAGVVSSGAAAARAPTRSVVAGLLRWPYATTRRTQVVALGVIGAGLVTGL